PAAARRPRRRRARCRGALRRRDPRPPAARAARRGARARRVRARDHEPRGGRARRRKRRARGAGRARRRGRAAQIRRARARRRRLRARALRRGRRARGSGAGREARRVIDAPTPFLARAHRVMLGVAVASLLFGLVLGVVGDDFDHVDTNGANGFSRSALGFQAFAELLDGHGVPVVRSRYHTGDRVRRGDVVVLAAPDVDAGDDHDAAILTQLLEGGHTVLVVLPKWRPSRSDERGRAPKLGRVLRVDAKPVTALLHKIDEDAELVRDVELDVSIDGLGAEPEVARPQLVRSDALLPLVGGDAGILVGEMRQARGRTVVLSDPDLLANSGLGRGENAALALALVDSLRGEGGTVLLDETLHGLERVPSVWGELVRAPLKFGSAHVALLFVAAVLAGA